MIVLAIIVGIIVLLMLVPIGADVSYIGGELKLAATVCGVLIPLYPREEKEKAPKEEEKPEKEEEPKEEKPKKPRKKLNLSFTPEEILSLVKKVFEGLGKLFRIRIDRLLIHYVAAGSDPYQTAVTFGYVNAGLSTVMPILIHRFGCMDYDVWTDVSFTEEKMKLDAAAAFSIRIGQIFGAINTILFGAAGILLRNQLRLRKERRQALREAKKEMKETTDASPELERKNENGQE